MDQKQKNDLELQESDLVLQGMLLANANLYEPASISYTAIFNQLVTLAQKNRRHNEQTDQAA